MISDVTHQSPAELLYGAGMADEKQITLRVPSDVLDGIDARAKQVGLSRQQWIVRCARWAIHNLPDRQSGSDPAAKQKFADSAPPEVAGTRSVDMGLDMPEGK